jgi:ribosomal protein L28
VRRNDPINLDMQKCNLSVRVSNHRSHKFNQMQKVSQVNIIQLKYISKIHVNYDLKKNY